MAGIVAVGAALPSWRLSRKDVAAAWGERGSSGVLAVCADDEDALTLAAQAGERALAAAQATAESVDALVWATTRPPFAEGPNHALLAAALGLPPGCGGYLMTGSAHTGIEALFAATDLVTAGSARRVLVVCSEDPRPGPGTGWERVAAAAAGAAVIDGGEGAPATIRGRATNSDPVIDRYRGADDLVTRDLYDARLYREQIFTPAVTTVAAALAGGETLAGWSLPDPDGRLGAAVARKVDADAPALTGAIGYAGAAATLLGGFSALTTPGLVGLIGHGGGRTSGLVLDVTEPVPGGETLPALIDSGRPASYAEVLRAHAQLVPATEPMPMGVPPGSAAFVRGGREVLALLGARCVDCGTVATPPSIHPRCPACGSDKSTEVPLARTGTVHTYVVNHTMPAPFVAPLPIAVVDLDDGARLMLQVTGDGIGIDIGDPVRLVLRRYAIERGVPVYGYKVELAKEA
ncbi:MAG TPA: OB-fold domain-containing protein [Mycobacteriales bacterium]|nr:OB-fold domain-containing protein [Mycobacteriales bacterium]